MRGTHMQEVQCQCLGRVQEILPNILLPGSCPSGHVMWLAGALHCHAE